jgi:hypothetical protein
LKKPDNIGRAARLALIVLLWRNNHLLTSRQIIELTGIGLRSAQRDLKAAPKVAARFEELKNLMDNPKPVAKTYSVNETAELLGLHPRHIRLLMDNLKIGHKAGNFWRFTEADIGALKNRPNARHRVKDQLMQSKF